MELIKGGICAAKGFTAGGVHCGIRKNKSKRDLSLIFSEKEASAAAVYTTNLVKGAPLTVTKSHLENGKARAVICNSGNANTCNADGIEKAQMMCSLAANELGIKPDFMKNHDLHIHVPEGATPKDGPSAGVTMLSTLVSLLTETPARADTAMTGELTLTGRVLPIGGLKEKSMAAYTGGVKTVFIPKDNVPDLEDVDENQCHKTESNSHQASGRSLFLKAHGTHHRSQRKAHPLEQRIQFR